MMTLGAPEVTVAVEGGEGSTEHYDESTFTSENKENVLNSIKRLSRKELEGLVQTKVVEAVVKHSEAERFRNRILEMQNQKDKMEQRVMHLQKQVMGMGKAVELLLDNHNRNPNEQKKRQPPIKFYRSVALQVGRKPTS